MKSQENEETNYFFFCWIRNDWTLFRQRSQKWIYNCVILFVVSTWVEIFMDRGCFEGHEWFRYLGALRSNSFIRETHSPSIPIFLLIFHHVLFFFSLTIPLTFRYIFRNAKGKVERIDRQRFLLRLRRVSE